MDHPQTPNPPHLYSQALQLKLYQAFIFSIPILFSIILFLLFYLFYLKRRASNLSAPPQLPPRTLNQAIPFLPSPCEVRIGSHRAELFPIVLVDEELMARASQCCVCLGEFEVEEELHQVPSCKHVFHIDCIRHWLHSNSTCPLCRCSVVVVPTKPARLPEPVAAAGDDLLRQDNMNSSDQNLQIVLSSEQQQQQQQQEVGTASNLANF